MARALPILPVLVAEAILWLGFGALLPVLPLYLVDQGIDAATLGWIVAAWPAARLVGEPVFGWLADRTDKRLLMLAGLVATAIVVPMPLVFTGAPAFLAARALAGLATAASDPAARGYILDATPPAERGAAFGLYASAQMGGLLLGPAVGGLGAALGGGFAFPFVFCSAALVVSAAFLAVAVVRRPARRAAPVERPEREASAVSGDRTPTTLVNRLLLAAIVINVGNFFASGVYEVIWSLWMTEVGADIWLIGVTFAAFGLGVLLVAPVAGGWVDRRGPLPFIIIGSLGAAASGVLYVWLGDPILVVPISVFEGVAIALLSPALFAVVARATPAGRSSTTQGVFGAAGTLGTIVASIAAGMLFVIDLHLPFYVFSAVMLVTLLIGLLIGGRALWSLGPVVVDAPARRPAPAVPEPVAVAALAVPGSPAGEISPATDAA
jgi:MFS family permease